MSEPRFFKSPYSAETECVEIAIGDNVLVRDSKQRSSLMLKFTHEERRAFLEGVKHGTFDTRNT